MNYQISVEQRPSYLYVTVTGTNSKETVMAYLQDIVAECEQRDCFRILVDERLEGPRLEMMDVFSVADQGSAKARGQFDAIAFVDEKMGDMSEFAESVAVNRGLPMRIFSNVGDAERWIEHKLSGSDEQFIFWDGETRNH